MAQGFLESTPIEFKDFSGGLTDNFLQGDVTRYAIADNFLLTNDHKLEERHGSKIYDPTAYQLNTSGLRVTSLFLDQNETRLFGQSGRNIYTQSPDDRYGTSWSVIAGPTGNEAVCGGGIYNQLSTGEFQKQIFFTSDYGTLPGKLFRDHTNTWKAVSAGVPKMAWVPRYVDNYSLMLACIQLANDLRAAMILHMEDQAGTLTGTSSSYQHKYLDKYSLCYLKSETFVVGDPEYPGPSPLPTPADAATDEGTLYTLCNALALAYEHHRKDLAGNTPETGIGSRYYHQDIYLFPPTASYASAITFPYGGTSGTSPLGLGINAKLGSFSTINTLVRAASFLDELAQKWYWHQLSPYSHSTTNSWAMMSKYLLDTTNANVKIAPLYTSSSQMQVTPDYTEFMAFAQWTRTAFLAHAATADTSSDFIHPQADPYALITLNTPTDYDSAALTLFWSRWLYGQVHMADANIASHIPITFSSTNGSANITAVTRTSTGGSIILPIDSWVIVNFALFNGLPGTGQRVARVTASAAGTATLSKTANTTGANRNGEYSTSWSHGAWYQGDIVGAETTVSPARAGELLAAPGRAATSLEDWIDAGAELMTALGLHMANGDLGASTAGSHAATAAVKNTVTGVSAISGNPFFKPETASYIWASFYRYLYTVEKNGLIYVNEGAPVFSDALTVTKSYPVGTVVTSYNSTYFNDAIISQENKSATLQDIPQLENSLLTNYDTTVSIVPAPTSSLETGYYENLTIEIYRTTDTGTTFFYEDSIENIDPGTITPQLVTYNDSTNEAHPHPGEDALDERKAMYTTGGVVANDQPPVCKYVHEFNNFMYYGAITDTGQFFPQRVRQAIQSQPDSAPATFFDDMEDELTGLTSTRTNPIVMCKNSLYRLEGSFSSTGQGAMVHEKLSPSMGCLNSRSIVQTEVGVFFAGTDGFYYTDGFQLIKVSLELDKTYASLTKSDNQKQRIYGAYDKNTRRIYWAMQSQATSQDNDVFFVYYLNYGVKPSGVFTKVFTNDSWKPASVAFYQGNLVIGDSRGYLFKTDVWMKSDPAVDTTLAPSLWGEVEIPWKYRSCALDMGVSPKRKWITSVHASGENVGNADIQLNSINDMGRLPSGAASTLPLAPIQYKPNPRWGDPTIVWGDSSFPWKYDGKMDVWRRFPARSLRSSVKQIEYAPGDFDRYGYEDFPEFAYTTVDATLKTATLQTPSGHTSLVFPRDVKGYFISFDTDDYETSYEITALDVTSKIVTFSDSVNASTTSATAKWQITGTPKKQRVKITSFDVHTAILGDEFEAYMPPGRG